MKKTFKSILIALLFSNVIQAKTIQVTSPGADKDIQPAIQTAVSGAVNGDVIELPAGQFILNKSVVITKFISVKGQGMTKTILYRSESTPDATLSNDGNWRGMFRFNTNSSLASGIVVSDMTLKSKKPSLKNGDGLSVAADIGIEFSKCIGFIVTRCHFEYFGNGAVSVLHDDNLASGLIYGNEFIHNCKGYDALGLGYGVVVYGTNTKWVDDPKFGSGNFIFIEDNYFDYHRHSVAAGGCALYVFRYNTVRNNVAGNCAHAIDAHEARLESGYNYYSTRAIEVYNNNIVNTLFRDGTTNCPDGTPIVAGKSPTWLTECAIRTRGGEALIHNNTIEGYRFGVGLVTPKLSSTYPSPYQQGYLSAVKYGASHTGVDGDKSSGDVFIWNDTYKPYAVGNSQCVYFYNYTPTYIVQNRDFHLTSKAGYTPYTYPHPLRNTTTPVTPMALSGSSTNVTCSGAKNGSASVSATGGTGPYTYNWNSSPVQTTATATALAGGSYIVTVKDATGTTKTATVTVTEPTALSTTFNYTQETCSKKNGTATSVVSGGTGPYTYSWTTVPVQTSVTATGLTQGGYTLTVTDKNGCTQATKATVTAAAPLSATASATAETCGKKNGTATATVSTGATPFTYSWSTVPVQTTATATGLGAGSYSVTVTDKNGCTQVVPVTVTASASVNATTSMTSETCGKKNGTATATVSSGATPFTYSWSTVPVQTTATATGLAAGVYSVTVTDNTGCSKVTSVTITSIPPLSVTANLTTENCGKKDGTATAVVSGGTTPYTYVWSTLPVVQTTATATGLTKGGYTVTVTDKNGCSQALPVVIKESASTLSVTANLTTENCGKKDGTATAVVSGGTAPYTYIWSTLPVVQTTATATGLTHGGYTVTVKDYNGCSKALPIIIKETTTLSVTTNLTTENCGKRDGTATAVVSGGIAPYKYVWTTNPVQTTATATGLSRGGYTVTVTDAKGCSVATPVVIKTSYTPAAAITAIDANCSGQGGSAIVKVMDGVAPFTYQWNTIPAQSTEQAVNLSPGEYEVTVMDARGCTSSSKAKIAKSEPKFSLTTVKTDASCATCKDGSATVIVSGGETNSYAYAWSSKNNSITAFGNSATGLAVGDYGITVTDNKGCSKQATTTIEDAKTTGIVAEGAASDEISVFPNPAIDKFNITNDAFKPHESVLVVLYNTAGVEVYSKIIVKENEIIAVDTESRLEPGIYVIVASSQDHLYKKKIIITQ